MLTQTSIINWLSCPCYNLYMINDEQYIRRCTELAENALDHNEASESGQTFLRQANKLREIKELSENLQFYGKTAS